MKTLQNLVKTVFFLVTIVSIAQQGINYKAIVKDGGGNIVTNQNIDIQFIIYEGPGETTNVYQETHSPNTDANGIVIVNIGTGTTSDVFADINWAADDHFLNVQIDTGSGLTDMGTTQFMAVPYALNASNVSGLEALDEGNGVGWRLIGNNPDNFGNVGFNAVDLSYSSAASPDYGATGNRAIAMGSFTKASGAYSSTMGLSTTASGSYSTAMGYNSIASSTSALAIGINTVASGSGATAIGDHTNAESTNTLAIGRYNIGGGDAISWVPSDPLFEIGNGTSDVSRQNALTVLKNGNVGVNTNTPNVKLQVTNGTDASLGGTDGYIMLGNITGTNLAIDNNEIMARNNGSTSPLYLQNDGGDVTTGGPINVNQITPSGIAMRVNGAEALWYNGTYFSWGFGGSANFFSDDVGIGTSNPLARLHVVGADETGINVTTNSASETTLYALNASTSGSHYAIHGTSNSSDGTGVVGTGPKNGVYGFASAANSFGIGVRGRATGASSKGVEGVSTGSSGMGVYAEGNTGVYAKSDSAAGNAVYAFNTSTTGTNSTIFATNNSSDGTGITGSGPKTGVYGFASAANASGYGVRGRATGATAQGVRGEATGESGKAIYGEATGLYGKGIHVKVTSTHSSANAILAESGGGSSYAGYFVGNVHVTGVLSKSSGSFKIDHPLDPKNKYLSHSFVESPDMMNIYNGNITTDSQGNAIVEMPSYFEALNIDFRYQLTVIGQFAQAIVSKKIKDNHFEIKTDKPNVEVSWQVTGIRNDAFAKENRIRVEEEKESENMGKYLNPEVFN